MNRKNKSKGDGFKEIREILKQTAVRLDQMGIRLDQMGVRLDQTGIKLDQAGVRLDEAGIRIDRVAIEIAELKESQKKTDEQLKKTDEQLKKTDEQLKKTDEQLKKTDEQIRATEKLVNRTNRQVGELTDGWGKFVEGLVAPSVPVVFKSLGITIDDISPRRKRFKNGKIMEIDVLALGKWEKRPVALAVEVKSNLESKHVDEFLRELKSFMKFFPEYRGFSLYGVVAGIRLGDGVEQYAEKQGLYVLVPSGETLVLYNKKGFKPKVWH